MICNGQKRTISASNELGVLQIISESDTEWSASENVGHIKGSGL